MSQMDADPHPVLKGEIPVNCLEYVMAALGCFLSPDDVWFKKIFCKLSGSYK